jgi:S1-C subfamily serine protease
MLNFLNVIIKAIVMALAAGIALVGGIFSPAQVELPASSSAAQVSVEAPLPAPSSSVQISTSSTAPEQKILVTKNKPATTTKSEPVIAPPVPVPVAASAPAPAPIPSVISDPLPPQVNIDPETFVGILCHFNAILKDPATGETIGAGTLQARGSGVFVNSKGYILTNKHVVAPADELTTVNDNNGSQVQVVASFRRDHCDVGQLPKGTHLPTIQEIMAINPLVRIPVLTYTAQPVFLSSSLPSSDLESQYADFAILQITGLSADAPSFGFTSVPASFPYAKLLPINNYPLEKQQVVTYGFPGDVTAGMNEAFSTLTMTGSVGSVTDVRVGDSYYREVPLVIFTDLQITHGRSGSPLFWRGYMIGLTTFFIGENTTNSGSVASDAIIKGLQGTGYLGQ